MTRWSRGVSARSRNAEDASCASCETLFGSARKVTEEQSPGTGKIKKSSSDCFLKDEQLHLRLHKPLDLIRYTLPEREVRADKPRLRVVARGRRIGRQLAARLLPHSQLCRRCDARAAWTSRTRRARSSAATKLFNAAAAGDTSTSASRQATTLL
eukprot:6202010-Pleurochrysis_carterae.AAC.2